MRRREAHAASGTPRGHETRGRTGVGEPLQGSSQSRGCDLPIISQRAPRTPENSPFRCGRRAPRCRQVRGSTSCTPSCHVRATRAPDTAADGSPCFHRLSSSQAVCGWRRRTARCPSRATSTRRARAQGGRGSPLTFDPGGLGAQSCHGHRHSRREAQERGRHSARWRRGEAGKGAGSRCCGTRWSGVRSAMCRGR